MEVTRDGQRRKGGRGTKMEENWAMECGGKVERCTKWKCRRNRGCGKGENNRGEIRMSAEERRKTYKSGGKLREGKWR